MILSRKRWYWRLLASLSIVGEAMPLYSPSGILRQADCLLGLTFSSSRAVAQIIPDKTLGAESSVVTPEATDSAVNVIQGGARRVANLFHSFEQFSVPTGGTAYFNNATDIQNIIGRVTGASISNIDGLIQANSTANLFLLNPNGIVFGPNARLNIGGSFLASTASSINFADGNQFSATAAQTTPLLTVSVPVGLQFGPTIGEMRVQGSGALRNSDGLLLNREAGLTVSPAATLALVGNGVTVAGGILTTDGGRIELGSVASPSLVSLTSTAKGFSLGYESIVNLEDINLSGMAAVDASGEGGGDIQVQGKQVMLQDGARIEASTLAAGPGGTLIVRASDAVELSGDSSGLFTNVYQSATGSGGNLNVETAWLTLLDRALISANSYGAGPGGNVTIATGQLSVQGGSRIQADTFATGQAGNLTLRAAESVTLMGSATSDNDLILSGLSASVQSGAKGDGGNLTLTTGRLIAQDGAQVSARTFGEGMGGNLTVNAAESVTLSGISPPNSGNVRFASGLFTSVGSGATGDGGSLTLTTGRLSAEGGAQVSAATSGEGMGGNLTVSASESVNLSGISGNGQFASGLFTSVQSGATGDGGNLTLTTGQLIAQDGAQVSARTWGKGSAGNLTVNASESVALRGISPNSPIRSGLFTSVSPEATGNGGNLTLETGQLTVQDGAQVTAATLGGGAAGNLTVNASNSVELIGTGTSSTDGLVPSSLSARTEGSRAAGDLRMTTGQLIIRDGAELSVNSSGSGNAGQLAVSARSSIQLDNQGAVIATTTSGNGGNITLETQDFLLLRDDSQISATAGTDQTGGNGGNITINTPFIVAPPSQNSDITANAYSGSGGQVKITAQGLFGIRPLSRQELQALLGPDNSSELDPRRLSSSDITAISQTSASLSGQVTLNTPDVDPSRGLVTLPTNLVDASGLIAQSCQGSGRATASENNQFIVTGRGGLPPSPSEALSSQAVWQDIRPPARQVASRSSREVSSSDLDVKITSGPSSPIVEAQGWVINNKGEVVLTATAPSVTPQIPWLTQATCQTSQKTL